MMNQEARLQAGQPVVTTTTDNTRVPLPLAPVTHGPVANRPPVQGCCHRANRCMERTYGRGHVGTLRTLSVTKIPSWWV